MSQQIVALTGISGVGKTTFVCQLAKIVDFQNVTAGSLIAMAREARPETRDTIRHADLDENQRFLIEGFAHMRNQRANSVIMDGHVVIDNGQRLSKVPWEVFKALDISVMVHFEATPKNIFANRDQDLSRSRPLYPLTLLKRHQEISRSHAKNIADMLGIDFYIITRDDVDRMAAILVGK